MNSILYPVKKRIVIFSRVCYLYSIFVILTLYLNSFSRFYWAPLVLYKVCSRLGTRWNSSWNAPFRNCDWFPSTPQFFLPNTSLTSEWLRLVQWRDGQCHYCTKRNDTTMTTPIPTQQSLQITSMTKLWRFGVPIPLPIPRVVRSRKRMKIWAGLTCG